MGDFSRNMASEEGNIKVDNTANESNENSDETRVLEMPLLGLAGMELDNHISTLAHPRENGEKRLIVINRKVVK